MKKIAAVYARYSTDLQNDASVEDQVVYCRELAKRYGFTIDNKFIFFDRAKSGATMFERDGLLRMMSEIKQRKFHVIISENLTRLSRDKEDLPHIYKRCEFNEIKIWTNEGEVTDTHVVIRSLIGSQQLKDTADQVRRHHDARIREGKIPGSAAYGHRHVPGKKMEQEIDPEQAAILVRIFTEYTVLGKSTRQIAEGLTRDGVPSPSGGSVWNHQVFTSNRNRNGSGIGGGLLNNSRAIGQVVWNASRNVRNPDTGKVVRRANKPEDVITVDLPHLRIIDQDLWNRTQALIQSRSEWRFGPGGKRPKRTSSTLKGSLLSGLVVCGACGGGMILTSSRRLTVSGGKLSGPFAACNAAHYHSACSHRKSYDLAKMERVVLQGMRENLTNPKALAEATKAYHAQWAARQREDSAEREQLTAKLTQLERRIDRVVDAITESDLPMETLKAKLRDLETEKVATNQRLKLLELEGNVVTLHPAAIEKFTADIHQIHDALASDLEDERSRMAFRNIFQKVVVHPTERGADYEVTPYARLSAVMGFDLFPKIRSVEEVVKEQRLGGSDLASQPTRAGQNWTSDLICLGRWRVAA